MSRIVGKVGRDGKPAYGIELTAAGEAMAALWRGVHTRWSFLTASNYIIMPDHLHLLLIVDYGKAQGFDILDWFQRFRREGEDVVSPIIGVKPEFDGLRVDPSIPAKWDGFKASRQFRGDTYEIEVKNPGHVNKGVKSLTVDGKAIDGCIVPVAGDGATHKVEVVLG